MGRQGCSNTCNRVWAAIGRKNDDNRIGARLHTVLQPQLTRRSHVEALVCRQRELLPEAAAAQLRQRLGASVAAVYLSGDMIVPLAISEVMKSATDAA